MEILDIPTNNTPAQAQIDDESEYNNDTIVVNTNRRLNNECEVLTSNDGGQMPHTNSREKDFSDSPLYLPTPRSSIPPSSPRSSNATIPEIPLKELELKQQNTESEFYSALNSDQDYSITTISNASESTIIVIPTPI